MKGRKHTTEQVIRKLREGERLAAEGKNVAEVARELEISEQTYSRWRNQYGGMKADDAVAALGSGIAQAAQSALHSSGESAFRPAALAASITARTAERS